MNYCFTREEDDAIARRCYEARWGYDGMGGIGPKITYEDYRQRERDKTRPVPAATRPGAIERARHHRKGNGWKANHEGNI